MPPDSRQALTAPTAWHSPAETVVFAQPVRSSAQALRTRLRALLDSDTTLIVPGVYDALSALMVQRAGFCAIHLGSYSVASGLGLPDTGAIGLAELAAATKAVTRVVDLPVIADAEDGFHGSDGIWQTVRAFEDAGAAAIHIEDHVSGKHSSMPRIVMSAQEIVSRIRAAVAARRDSGMMVIARTDIAWATGDVMQTAGRVDALADAGADAVMVVGIALADLRTLRKRCAARIVVLSACDASVQIEGAAGADMVIYHDFCLSAAMTGVANGLDAFASAMAAKVPVPRIDPLPQLRTLVGYDDTSRDGGEQHARVAP